MPYKIKEARSELKMSQEELAKKIRCFASNNQRVGERRMYRNNNRHVD